MGSLVPFLKMAEKVLAPKDEVDGLYMRFFYNRNVFGIPAQVEHPEEPVVMMSPRTRWAHGIVMCYGKTPTLVIRFAEPKKVEAGKEYEVAPFVPAVTKRDITKHRRLV